MYFSYDSASKDYSLPILYHGLYQMPHLDFFERELENYPDADIDFIRELDFVGHKNSIGLSEVRSILKAISGERTFFKENIYKTGDVTFGIRTDRIPSQHTAYSDARGRVINPPLLLLTLANHYSEQNPTPIEFWVELVGSKTSFGKWEEFRNLPISSEDVLLAYDKVGWSVDFWVPSIAHMRLVYSYLERGILGSDALAWILAMWKSNTELNGTQTRLLMNSGIDQYDYIKLVEIGITDTSVMIEVGKHDIDLNIASIIG